MSKGHIIEVLLVGGSSRIYKIQELLSEFFNGIPLNKNCDPDYSVIFGLGLISSYLNGDGDQFTRDILCIDTNPHRISINLKKGKCIEVIRKNFTIPSIKK